MEFTFEASKPVEGVAKIVKKRKSLSVREIQRKDVETGEALKAGLFGRKTTVSYRDMIEKDEEGGDDDFSEDEMSDEEQEDEGVGADPTCPSIRAPKELLKNISRKWSKAVIVKLLGKSFPTQILYERLTQRWKTKGSFDIFAIGNGYFSILFDYKEDSDYVLYGGPWMISDHYLTVRRWVKDFDIRTEALKNLDVWVRFPDLKVEYLEESLLSLIGNSIGKVRKIELFRSKLGNAVNGRVCVSIDLAKPLVGKFLFRKEIQRNAYEGIHLLCFHCGRFGHQQKSCPLLVDDQAEVNVDGYKMVQKPMEEKLLEKDNFGSWMKVSRKRGGPLRKSNISSGKIPGEDKGREQQKVKLPSNANQRSEESNSFAVLSKLDQENQIRDSLEKKDKGSEAPANQAQNQGGVEGNGSQDMVLVDGTPSDGQALSL